MKHILDTLEDRADAILPNTSSGKKSARFA
jgi:hypothetical protein